MRSKKVLTAVKICDFGNGERFFIAEQKRFSQPSKSVILETARGSYSGAKRFSQPSKSVILETARGSYSGAKKVLTAVKISDFGNGERFL